MNVLIVAQSLDKGGRTKRIADLATALVQRGFCITLCAFDEPPAWVKVKYPILSETLTLERLSGGRFRHTRQIMQVIREHKIDVVHAHCDASAFHCGLAGRLTRTPSIGTYHRSIIEFYRPYLKYIIFARLLTHCVAISKDRMRLMINNHNISPDKITLIHGAFDLKGRDIPASQAEARKRLQLDDDSQVLLSLGHLGQIKGHDYAIAAMPEVIKDFPQAHLYIGGQGSKEDEVRINQVIEKLEIQEHITLLGEITNPFDWLTACEIFVQTPLEEGFGLVFVEAGACRKPVVATAVGGIKDIIIPGQTGLMVTPRNSHVIAVAIKQILGNPEQAKAMGEQAKQRVEKHFTLDTMVDKYVEVYRKFE